MNKKEWDRLVERVAKQIYKGTLKGVVDNRMIQLHAQELMGAIENGFGSKITDEKLGDDDYDILYNLQRNCYHFSGAKNWNQIQEMSSLLTRDGQTVSFANFLKDVKEIDKTYNQSYLKAEYNHALTSGQMAGKWTQFMQEADALPYLEYDAVMDGRTREDHAKMDKIVRPIKDDFWKKYYPPNGWNCRCKVRQLDQIDSDGREAEPLPALPKVPTMFQNNVAIDGQAFSSKHSYFKTMPEKVRKEVMVVSDSLLLKNSFKQMVINKFDKGKVLSSSLVNTKASDYETILDICKHFAKQGNETEILPRFDVPLKSDLYAKFYAGLKNTPYWGKCPDFRVGDKFYEFEGYSSEGKYSRMLKNGIKQSENLILSKTSETEKHLKKLIKFRINNGQKISEVWIYEKGKLIKFHPLKTQ